MYVYYIEDLVPHSVQQVWLAITSERVETFGN